MEEKRKEEEEEEGYIARFESDIPLPPLPNTNYTSFLLTILSQHGEKKALVDAHTGKHHTYNDICAMVPRVCAGLRSWGVARGDAVLLLSPNHIDFPIANLAIILLPAVCVPVNPALSPEEAAHVIRVSGARWAIVEEGVVGVIEQVAPLLAPNTLKGVWVMGASPHYPSFASLMRGKEQDINNDSSDLDAGTTVALMPFSSGTTGQSKGVMLTHRSLLTAYFQSKHLVDLSGEEGRRRRAEGLSRVLLALPMYHSYGFNTHLSTFMQGGMNVLMARFSFRSFLHAIQKYKITYAPLVPHIATRLLHTPLLQEFDLSSLHYLFTGSAPIPEKTQQALMAKLNRFMGNGYGLTETCAPVAVSNPRHGYKPGALGKIMPYVEVKIVEPGTRRGLGVGEEGEVWVRGPGIMLGYAVGPDSPLPKGLEEGGWLPTGDIGKVDEEGFIYLTDRLKDLIKVKGYQVSPNELEEVLRKVEGVGEVAVVGVPSERLGEAPRAYVVPTPGLPAPSPQALEEFVAARVAPYKRLAGGVEVVEELPKNALGKVLKRRLRENFLKASTAATTTAAAKSKL